jgi:hypothetical protein
MEVQRSNVSLKCRAIAQAVSRWLPTAATRVQTRVWSSGICDGQSGARAGFLRDESSPYPQPMSLKSILISSCHLCLDLPTGLFISGFPIKSLYSLLFLPS